MRPAHSPTRAFTLIEMMITVALLGFIVLGLTAMFIQTQKAFRAGVAQSDVLESGRAAVDLMVRDLESATPSRIPQVTNFLSRYETFSINQLTGSSSPRTNVLSSFFFLTEYNRDWKGVGYVVAVPDNRIDQVGVGTLYRFEYAANFASPALALSDIAAKFTSVAPNAIYNLVTPDAYATDAQNISSNFTRVCDGVISLRVLGYDRDGLLLTNAAVQLNNSIIANYAQLGMIEYTCTNNALPAYFDLELAVLEAKALERFKAIPVAAAQQAFLARQANAIHVFRRRVAVHEVDPEAYP